MPFDYKILMNPWLLLMLVLSVAVLAVFIRSRQKAKRIRETLSLKLLSVRLPRVNNPERVDIREEINKTAQLYANLSGMKQPFVLEAAVKNVGQEISFYIAVDSQSVQFVQRQIEGIWPGAVISEEREDYSIFTHDGKVRSAYIKQTEGIALPIKTYEEAGIDTFASILSGLSKVAKEGEGVAIQIIADDAPGHFKKSILDTVKAMRLGDKEPSPGEGMMITPKDLEKALFSSGDQNEKPKEEKRVVDEKLVEAVESKMSKQLLSVNIRVIASAKDDFSAEALLQSVVGGFSQFGAPRRNELKPIGDKNTRKSAFDFAFRIFDPDKAIILNTAELASVFHLPIVTAESSKVSRVRLKEVAPPQNLPSSGILIGESRYRGENIPIRLSDTDRRRHLYIVGQTGTGKSAFIKNMAVEDIRNGKGMAIVDPHGDLADDILSLVPKERIDDIVVFNPGDLNRPLGLNMLEYDFNRPEEKTFIVNEILGIFGKLFSAETMGPMFEQYMRNALLLLMEDMRYEPATLVEVGRIFTDEAYRERKIARSTNPVVIDFWTREAKGVSGEGSIANMTPYITSKLNTFTANDYIRPIIGQATSSFDFRKVMDEGKVLIVNLSKGKIGEINANLLGMVVVGKLLMAAMSRVDLDEEKRKDFYLYIDEFQNFTTDSIATILSEARKYKLDLIIAHQFIAQLSDKIRDAVFGNVGSMAVFRVGMTDAEFLEKQFLPTFAKEDLANIDNYNFYAKLLLSGQPSEPFNVKTVAPQKGSSELKESYKAYSSVKYGKSRDEVENEMIARLRK